MTAYSKEGESLLKKYEREDNLMFPLHKSDIDNPVRKTFVQDLMNNENFRKTNQANEPKLEEPIKKVINSFGIKHYVGIAVLTAMYGTLGYGITKGALPKTEKQNTETKKLLDYAPDIALITLVLLASIAASVATVASVKQSSIELAYERTFSRIAVRLFDDRKKRHPELDEEILKLCNPELGRVIKVLLIANMPDRDLRKVKSIAKSILNQHSDNRQQDIEIQENLLEEAMKIVKSILITNPWLKKTITEVYKGQIPAVFTTVIQEEKQKIQ